MVEKINLRVITKSHADDPEIVFLTKSINHADSVGVKPRLFNFYRTTQDLS